MKQKTRKISVVGLTLCVIYGVIALALVALALSESDPKGRFVLLQLPIALQMGFVHAVGLGGLLHGLSWTMAYVCLGIPTLVALYFGGAYAQKLLGAKSLRT